MSFLYVTEDVVEKKKQKFNIYVSKQQPQNVWTVETNYNIIIGNLESVFFISHSHMFSNQQLIVLEPFLFEHYLKKRTCKSYTKINVK